VEHRSDGLEKAVLGLADRLGMTVIAEGLETQSQLELVRQAGCRLGQGFLIRSPRRAERFAAYLDSNGAADAGPVSKLVGCEEAATWPER
jgi:EAL domain-containing protein (putative c-di-GMP-specific phosphodiesterase class I)